jgi:hypothetical protein
MQGSKYFIRKNSFICLAGRYYVVLNLVRDKYLCIEQHEFELLKPWIICRRPDSPASVSDPLSELKPNTQNLANELIASGVLTINPTESEDNTYQSVDPPTDTLCRKWDSPGTLRYLAHSPEFFAAARSANRSLQSEPIAQTVQRVFARKQRALTPPSSFPLQKTKQLVAAFNWLRPFYDRQYLCLFDSLALLDFLSQYTIYPTWVFGVQSEPFAAHCWVQDKDRLLNDTVERVRLYTPVLAI